MDTPANTTLDEIRSLISAQLDMLERGTRLTPDELEEMHRRAERIRMLCKQVQSNEPEAITETEPEESHLSWTRIRAHSLAA